MLSFFLLVPQAVGVLAPSTAGGRSLTELGSARAQNVAKTIGFTTFAKTNHLWLQREGRSTNAAAATDDLFSQML